MGRIELRDYQVLAMKKLLSVNNSLLCADKGTGKTFISVFLARYLLKNKKVNKTVFCVTNSGVGVFKKGLEKFGLDINLIDTIDKFVDFLSGSEKFIIIKHSFMEELGQNKKYVDVIEDYLKCNNKKILLIIDEAHRFSNHQSWGNFAVDSTRRFYENIVILTATPYSSSLLQIYGLVKIIYPDKWRSPKEFKDAYIEEEIVKDWRTGKFLRVEPVRYKNLSHLRKEMEEFTFFWFPPIKLNYYEHKVKLSENNYSKYVELCRSVYEEVKDRNSNTNKKDIADS